MPTQELLLVPAQVCGVPSGIITRAMQVIRAHQAGEPLPPAPGAVCASCSRAYTRWLLALQALELRDFGGQGSRYGDGGWAGDESEGGAVAQGGNPARGGGEVGNSHYVGLTAEKEDAMAAADSREVGSQWEGMQGGNKGEQRAPERQAVRFLLEVAGQLASLHAR